MTKSKSAYSVPGKIGKIERRIIVVWVDNEAGVLARIAGLFSGRGYNIESLVVSPAFDGNFSRMTISCSGELEGLDQIIKQVDKIVAGDYNPIVVDCNNKIVNGHHRWEAAKLLGYEEMAVAKLPYKISTIVEKWSRKYKKSINCNNPKGFSQKAHCAGKKKKANEDVDLNTQRGRLEYYMNEPIGNDMALHLGKLPKYFDGTDPLADMVPDRVGKFALHPDNWEGTYYSLTNKDTAKIKFYKPQLVKIPANSVVGDIGKASCHGLSTKYFNIVSHS